MVDSLGVYQTLVSGEMAVVLECQDLPWRTEWSLHTKFQHICRGEEGRRVLMGFGASGTDGNAVATRRYDDLVDGSPEASQQDFKVRRNHQRKRWPNHR